jgi:hypothetical protein
VHFSDKRYYQKEMMHCINTAFSAVMGMIGWAGSTRLDVTHVVAQALVVCVGQGEAGRPPTPIPATFPGMGSHRDSAFFIRRVPYCYKKFSLNSKFENFQNLLPYIKKFFRLNER